MTQIGEGVHVPAAQREAANSDRSKIFARWSRCAVTPNHNAELQVGWTATENMDWSVPSEAIVELEVDTIDVPEETAVEIMIMRCGGGHPVDSSRLTDLVVRHGRVVNMHTNARPTWHFESQDAPWSHWNTPFFFFEARINYKNLVGMTEKDFEASEGDCLRVARWHVCLAESSDLENVLQECQRVSAILNGIRHSKSAVCNTTNVHMRLADYGSYIRNTYIFHQASHGAVLSRASPEQLITDVARCEPPDDVPNPAEWRSVVSMVAHISNMPQFGDAEIRNYLSVLSVPRYLWYSSTCYTGWESSFADALIARGCRNVIAFRRWIPDSVAPHMAWKFYDLWANDHNLDPEKIPDCFFQVATDYYESMRPVLFGEGGGSGPRGSSLSTSAIVGIAATAVVIGATVGVGLYKLLK